MKTDDGDVSAGAVMTKIRCPHCGSPVTVRGRWWECGWCGDCGQLGSLHPSERAKLNDLRGGQAAAEKPEDREEQPGT